MSTASTPATSDRYVDFDEYVEFQLDKTRKSIKFHDLMTAGAAAIAMVLAGLLLFVVLDHWVVPGGFTVTARWCWFVSFAAALAGWFVWKIGWRAFRSVNRLFAAKELELADPALRSNLLNWVDLHDAGRKVHPSVMQTIEKQAATELSKMDVGQAVDHRPLLQALYALLAVVILFCGYALVSPKRVGSALWRILPFTQAGAVTRTEISEVVPGDATLLARGQLEVAVMLSGEIPDTVQMLYSTADGRIQDEAIELRPESEGLPRFRGVFAGENGSGVLQDFTYRILAGDAESKLYRVTVHQPPSATVQEVALQFPEYMKLEDAATSGGHIDGWEGAVATISATADKPCRSAVLQFLNDPQSPPTGEEVPVDVTDGTQLRAVWTLGFRSDNTAPKHYRIQCRNDAGEVDPAPTVYNIAIRPDRPPEIVLLHPERDLVAPANAVIPLLVQASDPDFELAYINLLAEKGGQSIHRRQLSEGRQSKLTLEENFDLSSLPLQTGDEIEFWVEAYDNKQPRRNRKNTPRLKIRIEDPVSKEQADENFAEQKKERDNRLAEAQQEQNPNGNPPGEPKEGDEAEPPERDPMDQSREPRTNEKSEQQPDDPMEAGQEPQPENAGENAKTGRNPQPNGQSGENGKQTGEAQPGEKPQSEPLSSEGDEDEQVLQKLTQRFNERNNKDRPQNDEDKPSAPGKQDKSKPENKPGEDDTGRDEEMQENDSKPQTDPAAKPERNPNPKSKPDGERDRAKNERGKPPAPGKQDQTDSDDKPAEDDARDDMQTGNSEPNADPAGKPEKTPNPKSKPQSLPKPGDGKTEKTPSAPSGNDPESDSEPKESAEEKTETESKPPMKSAPKDSANRQQQPGKKTDGESRDSESRDGDNDESQTDSPVKPVENSDSKPGAKPPGAETPEKSQTKQQPGKTDAGKDDGDQSEGEKPEGKPDDMPEEADEKPSQKSQPGQGDKPQPSPDKKQQPERGKNDSDKQRRDDKTGKQPPGGGEQSGNQPGEQESDPSDGAGSESDPNSENNPADGNQSKDSPKKSQGRKPSKPSEKQPSGDPGSSQPNESEGSDGGEENASDSNSDPQPSGDKPQPDDKGKPKPAAKKKSPADKPTSKPEKQGKPDKNGEKNRSEDGGEEPTDRAADGSENKREGDVDEGEPMETESDPKAEKKPRPDKQNPGAAKTDVENPEPPKKSEKSKPKAKQKTDGEPKADDEEPKGEGEPKGQKSEQPNDGEGGGSKQDQNGNPGSETEGPGEKTDKPGDQQTAKEKTGKSDPKQQTGKGDKSKPGNKQQGGGEKSGKEQGAKQGGDQSAPQPGGETGKQESGEGSDESGPGEGQASQDGRSESKPDAQSGTGKPSARGNAGKQSANGVGNPEQGGGSENGTSGPGGNAEETVADPEAANLDYNRRAAELVLQRLKDDLNQDQVDPKLLEELGWTPEQLQKFVDRLARQLEQPVEDLSPLEEARRRQFEEMLKSLDLKSSATKRSGGNAPQREVDQSGGKRAPVPADYKAAYEAFTKNLAKQKPAKPAPNRR